MNTITPTVHTQKLKMRQLAGLMVTATGLTILVINSSAIL